MWEGKVRTPKRSEQSEGLESAEGVVVWSRWRPILSNGIREREKEIYGKRNG